MSALPYIEHVHLGTAGLHVDAYRRMLERWATEQGLSFAERRGAFDANSAALVREFQRRSRESLGTGVGPTGSIGPATHEQITRWADDDARALLWDEYKRRHPTRTARRIAVEAAFLALAKRGRLVYSGRGRATVDRRWQGIDERIVPPAVLTYADCSSLATWCLWLARDHGAIDPSARDWRSGSTATMEPNGRPVSLEEALPGALFFYDNPRLARHVTIMVERVRGVPFVVSFGVEGGPTYVRYDYRRALSGSDDVTSVRDYINEP